VVAGDISVVAEGAVDRVVSIELVEGRLSVAVSEVLRDVSAVVVAVVIEFTEFVPVEELSAAMDEPSVVVDGFFVDVGDISVEECPVALDGFSVAVEGLSVAVDVFSKAVEEFSVSVDEPPALVEEFSVTV
jgi:hypothetical protein